MTEIREIDDDVIDKVLMDLGLTKYEAMVYRSLIKLGEAKAVEIAQASGVPREKTYQVLRELDEKNITKRIGDKPKKWTAQPPLLVFENMLREKKKRLEKVMEVIAYLQKCYEKGSLKVERKELKVWEISCDSLHETLVTSLNYAQLSVHMLLSPNSIEKFASSSYLDLFKKLHKKGISIKIISSIEDDNIQYIAKLNQYADIYVLRNGKSYDISVILIDEKEMLIIKDGYDYVIHSLDPRITQIFGTLLNELMKHCSKSDDYIEYYQAIETLKGSDVLLSEVLLYGPPLVELIKGYLKSGQLGTVTDILTKTFKGYSIIESLPIENRVNLINLMLKNSALFHDIYIELRKYEKVLTVEIIADAENNTWVDEIKEYPVIVPPIPHLILLLADLNGMGWINDQVIWIEHVKDGELEDKRKIEILYTFM
ncbi:MAG: helix-turn-helix domain-containing protein [Candidatus Geothermarchaeota archaeon]